MAGPDVFTQLEETRLRKLFDYLDEDRDGFVTHHDLRRLCVELGRDMAEERAMELIARADPEKHGKIGWKNFCMAMGVVLIKLKVALILIAAFKELDKENTGFIERQALKQLILDAKVDLAEDRIEELIRKCNPGPDGRIRFEDFTGALVAHLRR
jgi:Ca2+-binding EF-hand superfamily protein